MGLIETLKSASDYRKESKGAGQKDKIWITISMKKKEHSQLKEMSIWNDLSQSETLKIIVKNAYNDFTDKVVGEVSK